MKNALPRAARMRRDRRFLWVGSFESWDPRRLTRVTNRFISSCRHRVPFNKSQHGAMRRAAKRFAARVRASLLERSACHAQEYS